MSMSLPVVIHSFPANNIIENYDPMLHFKPIRDNSERVNWISQHEREFSLPLQDLQAHSKDADQREFLAEMLNFQATCNHPAVQSILHYMMKLKHENLQANLEKAELENFISHHSETLFQDIARELYDTIKSSPRLKKRLAEYYEKSESVEIKELIETLEKTGPGSQKQKPIHEEWVWVGSTPEQTPMIIDADLTGLDDLERQIILLEKAGRSSGNARDFMVEIHKLRKETKTGQPWGKTLYQAAALTWRAISAVYYAITIVQSAMPTVVMVAPFILPIRWLSVIQFLLRIFH